MEHYFITFKKMFHSIHFSQILTNRIKNNLGRWNINDNQILKQMYANRDSCGDTLCGNPKDYKKHASKIIHEEKKKNN